MRTLVQTERDAHYRRSHSYGADFSFQHSPHLQLGKLLSFVAGVLCINELGEEELAELWALSGEQRRGG